MQLITTLTILSLLFLSFKTHIPQIQCTSFFEPIINNVPNAINEQPINFNPFDLNQQQYQLPKTIDPNVKKTCYATDNPDLCFASLAQYLKENNGDVKTDTFSLLEIQIKATTHATQIAITLVSKIGRKNNDGQALEDCKEMYDDALDNLQKALKALTSHDIGTTNTMLSAAITDFGTCDDGYKEGGDTSPMAEYGKKLIKLVSNCLATVSLIKG